MDENINQAGEYGGKSGNGGKNNAQDFSSNHELLEKIAAGDQEALDELVRRNTGLVRSIACRFSDRRTDGFDSEDLMQRGTIGMIKAARSFDFSFNTAFSTYAVPLIIGEIRRFLRDNGTVKVSRATKKLGSDIMKTRENFISQNGREPSAKELAEKSGISCEQLVFALESVMNVKSLSDAVGTAAPNGRDDNVTLENVLADKNSDIENLTDTIALSEAVDSLPPVWKQIVRLRYEKNLSQQQTGDILGMTQVKISREEKKILTKLREILE